MTEQVIVLPDGNLVSGRLIEHLPKGQATVEWNDQRFTGEKFEHWTIRQTHAR